MIDACTLFSKSYSLGVKVGTLRVLWAIDSFVGIGKLYVSKYCVMYMRRYIPCLLGHSVLGRPLALRRFSEEVHSLNGYQCNRCTPDRAFVGTQVQSIHALNARYIARLQ